MNVEDALRSMEITDVTFSSLEGTTFLSFRSFLDRWKNESNQALIWSHGRDLIRLGIIYDEKGDDKENQKPPAGSA